MIIEIKSATNKHYRARDINTEKAKDLAISRKPYKFIKLYDKDYTPFLNFLIDLKSSNLKIKEISSQELLTEDSMVQSLGQFIGNRHKLSNNVNFSDYERDLKVLATGREIFLLFTKTKSGTGVMIERVSRDPYTHVSLSFDKGLETAVSFISDAKDGGFMREDILDRFLSTSEFELYKIAITRQEFIRLIEFIKDICLKGSTYASAKAILNAGLGYKRAIKDKQDAEYNMFCSEFVYYCLIVAGLEDKLFGENKTEPHRVTPYNIFKLANKKYFKYVSSGNLHEYFINTHADIMEVQNKQKISNTAIVTWQRQINDDGKIILIPS